MYLLVSTFNEACTNQIEHFSELALYTHISTIHSF